MLPESNCTDCENDTERKHLILCENILKKVLILLQEA